MDCSETTTTFQQFLDVQTRAICEKNFDAYLATLLLPCRLHTLSHDTIMETPEQVSAGFHRMVENLENLRINDFFRITSQARRLGTRFIEGFHISHAMHNAVHQIPAFTGRSVIVQIDGEWRMTETERNVSSHHWHTWMHHVPGTPDTDPKPVANDCRCDDFSPHRIYRDVLNEVSEAIGAQNFDKFAQLHAAPYSFHDCEHDHFISTRAEMRNAFDTISFNMKHGSIDTVKNHVKSAEFIASDILCGYHQVWSFKNNWPSRDPFEVRMVLKLFGSDWKIKSVTIGAKAVSSAALPMASDTLEPLNRIQERTGKWELVH